MILRRKPVPCLKLQKEFIYLFMYLHIKIPVIHIYVCIYEYIYLYMCRYVCMYIYGILKFGLTIDLGRTFAKQVTGIGQFIRIINCWAQWGKGLGTSIDAKAVSLVKWIVLVGVSLRTIIPYLMQLLFLLGPNIIQHKNREVCWFQFSYQM